ncbi:MAG: chorismate mutase [Eubacteriales bacterium]|nr:chorismate mutase [Eubacteriales bacterium]
MDDLQEKREKINIIDKEMAVLFEKRMEIVKDISNFKREHAIPILNSNREKEVIDENIKYINNLEYHSYYSLFIKNIMDLSKKYQRRVLKGIDVGFSGVEGAFAHIASTHVFKDANYHAYPNFQDAYNSVVIGECECCLLPIENSSAGDVSQVMDMMFSGPLYVNGIYNLKVRQNLLAIKGSTIDTIKTVISHPQALSQCTKYIQKHKYNTLISANTAIAAMDVKEKNDYTIAAIASEETAKIYGLEIIDHDINLNNDNTTKFAILSLKCDKSVQDADESIIFFTVKNEAGALAKAINIIGEYKFNMRSLRSLPMKELSWQYYFYVEFDGNIYTSKGMEMVKKLQQYCDKLKILGSFIEYKNPEDD